MRFAHMKRIFRLDRLRLRGLSGVKDEVLLTSTAQNLRRLVKFLYRPPPLAPAACAAYPERQERIPKTLSDVLAAKRKSTKLKKGHLSRQTRLSFATQSSDKRTFRQTAP